MALKLRPSSYQIVILSLCWDLQPMKNNNNNNNNNQIMDRIWKFFWEILEKNKTKKSGPPRNLKHDGRSKMLVMQMKQELQVPSIIQEK